MRPSSYTPKREDLTILSSQVVITFEFDCSQYTLTMDDKDQGEAKFHMVIIEPPVSDMPNPVFLHVRGHFQTQPSLHAVLESCGHDNPTLMLQLLELILSVLPPVPLELPSLSVVQDDSEPS